MLTDKYSKYDSTFGLDNKYFDVDYNIDDYISITGFPPAKTGSSPAKMISKFTDGSAPPNEKQSYDDNTIISSELPANTDYENEKKTSDDYIYDRYNTKKYEPYMSPNSILRKSRFENIGDLMVLSWFDVMVFLNFILSILLMFQFYKMHKKIKKIKHMIPEYHVNKFNLDTATKLPMN